MIFFGSLYIQTVVQRSCFHASLYVVAQINCHCMWKYSRLELYSGLRVKKHSLSIGVFSFLISHLVFVIYSKKLLYVLVVVWFLLGIYCMWIYLTHTIKIRALWMVPSTPDLLHVSWIFIVCYTVCSTNVCQIHIQ